MLQPFLLRALLFGLGLAVGRRPLGCFVVWRAWPIWRGLAQAALIGVALALALSLDVTAGVLIVTLAVSGLLLLLGGQQVVPFDSLLGLVAHAALAAGVVAASLASGRQPDLLGVPVRRHPGHHQRGPLLAAPRRRRRGGRSGGNLAPLLSLSVNEDIAAAEGTATGWVGLVFVAVLALVVAIAIEIVGALLTIAFLIMPAAARARWPGPGADGRHRRRLGMLAVAAGLLLSVTWDTPAGPSIVLVLAVLFALSIVRRCCGGGGRAVSDATPVAKQCQALRV